MDRIVETVRHFRDGRLCIRERTRELQIWVRSRQRWHAYHEETTHELVSRDTIGDDS